MRVLVIGSNGQLGWELMNQSGKWGFDASGYDLPEFDITDPEAARLLLGENDFSAVVNAAAYTAVDQAEENRELAFAVNCSGAANLARACVEAAVPLVHLSTDYVFDGRSNRPYLETDPVSPLGVYGRSKVAGEREVQRILPDHIIVRTAWLFGLHGENFVKTMLRLRREKDEIRVVADQHGSPTFAADLADALLQMVSLLQEKPGPVWGVYHYCGEGITSWYEFAAEIFRLAGLYDTFPVRLIPIPTEEFPTLAQRPAYSVLDCTRVKSSFGVHTRPWRKSLAEMVRQLHD